MTRPTGQVVTRFAPSPTGYLHIGGARTALFNWAYARRHGGRFILRLEDTDAARSTVESARSIIEDMRWLGIDWDEGPDPAAANPIASCIGDYGPYAQSQRLEIYNQRLEQLMAEGKAYEKDGAIVFRMPRRDITVHDLVLGDVTTPADKVIDLVIRKSDGFPTFHFANVIDDATMGVTHVIRAQEHLNNTHKHLALFEALGLTPPQYAHIPLIFNPDGTKMSKRDKAKTARQAAKAAGLKSLPGVEDQALADFLEKKTDDTGLAAAIARHLNVRLPEIDVHDFRVNGYLPSVLNNYLSLLGWSPGGNIEKFDNQWLAQNFALEGIGKSNARFDREKLFRFNGDALQALPPEVFVDHWRNFCRDYEPDYLRLSDEHFAKLAAAYRPRARTLREPCELGRFFIAADDAIVFDDKAMEKVMRKDGGFEVLRVLRGKLAELPAWTAEAIEALVKGHAEASGLGIGKVAQPLRVAVTGSTVSPGIGETLEILGQSSTLKRIDRCLARA